MIKTIQSIRFYIILSIFITHLFFLQKIPIISNIYSKYFSNGALGVTFFFILSGFVIRIGYGDKFKNISLKNYFNFVKKRIIKIYPLYIISMFIMFIYILYINSFQTNIVISNLKRFLLCIPLLQTLIPIQEVSQSFNGAAWFLSTLFILYILTPFLLYLNYKDRQSVKHSIIKMFIIYLTYLLILFIIIKFIPEKYRIGLMYCSPYIRIFQYILGILLGNIYVSLKNKTNYSYNILEIISTILFIISFLFMPTISKIITNYFKVSYLSTMISYSIYIFISLFMIYIFSFEKGIISKFLSKRLNLYLGDLSFYIYIIHLPLIEISYYFLSKYGLFINPFYYFLPVICLFITICLSIIYKKIKK